ncbi:MAG: hypothetical protein KR126chlam2_00915 [Chlamydiae bacterium]|nr:hypothetical protein [Chlamydiota bacterium]
MLKLTQLPNRVFQLGFRKRERAYSRNLIKGFSIALAFHLGLFCLFKITLPFNFDALTPSPPISVEVDLGQPSTHAPRFPQLSLSPLHTPNYPQLPSLPPSDKVEKLPYDWEIVTLEPDFSQIEKIPVRLRDDHR